MKEPDVALLIAALGGGTTQREAAIARLIIVGERSIGRLVEAYRETQDRAVRRAILRVLEATGDDRALDVAAAAIAAGGDLAVGGIAVLRELLGRPRGSADVQALDRLLAITRDDDVRTAVEGLAAEESAEAALWQDALAGQLPDEPAALREAMALQAEAAPLADLRRLIEAIAAREQREPQPGAAQEWLAARGAIHQALALRGSRIALYALAAAFARSSDARWQHQLARAFEAIVTRERMTARHAAVRRALARAPGIGKA
jgi:hypothetical protein